LLDNERCDRQKLAPVPVGGENPNGKEKMKSSASMAMIVATALWMNAASALTIFDPTDWTSGWVYSTVEVAGVGTASLTVEPAGGNPGARLNVTTVTPTGADTAFGAALYQAVTISAPTTGTSFVMKIDVLSGPGGFGGGQAVQVLVGQGGSLYQTNVGITGWPILTFTTLTYTGTFTAGAFTKVSGPGPATPSFDGVTPTSFGFAVGNNKSATLTQYYDNWNITFTPAGASGTPAIIPAVSMGSLLFLAILILVSGLTAWRKLK
jgi:hypothetical protein